MLESVLWSDIIVKEDRQRQKFSEEKLMNLSGSIDSIGLLQPPVIDVNMESGSRILIAGERRYRACLLLIELGKQISHAGHLYPLGEIPYLRSGNLTGIQLFEAELDENIQREDLTWQERAYAEAKLHELRESQNVAAGKGPQTLTATATEIVQRTNPGATEAVGSAITSVANRIRVAAFLADPDVANAKTEGEAVKVIRKKQEAARIETLAKTYDARVSKDSPHRLLVGDCVEHLGTLKDATVDVLLTDPPYGIDADNFGEQSGQGHNYGDSVEYFETLTAAIAEESFRVCKPQAHAYVFCDPRRFDSLKMHFEFAGWKVWPIPLIWAKGNGMLPRPEHAPRRTYECIMFASKGDKMVCAVKADVIAISGVRDLKHGAQKPVALYVDLLSRSVVPGDTVLDTCAGSGTIFPTANQLKVRAIGIELDEHNANIARIRMNETEDALPDLDTSLEEIEL
jgi:site-specific DNA-methyltransferase (adenine-specific)